VWNMADYVPCLFRETDARHRNGLEARIRQDWLCAVSPQVTDRGGPDGRAGRRKTGGVTDR